MAIIKRQSKLDTLFLIRERIGHYGARIGVIVKALANAQVRQQRVC